MNKSLFSILAFSLLFTYSTNAMSNFGDDKDKDKKKERKSCCTKKSASSCANKEVSEKSCHSTVKEQKTI